MTLVNRYGSEVTSAYGACLQLWNYIQMPAFALGSAVSAMAAQNVGAKLWDRVRTIARFGILYNIAMTATLVGVIALLDRQAFVLFLGDEAGAVEIAHHVNTVVSWSFVLFGVSFVLSSVVRSTGAVLPKISRWPLRSKIHEPSTASRDTDDVGLSVLHARFRGTRGAFRRSC